MTEGRPGQRFIIRTPIRLPVGWDCIEIYPGQVTDAWKPEYAPIWAERDIMAAVLAHQLREAHFHSLDPKADARKELAGVIPPGVLGYLLDAWGAAVGLPAWVTNTVEDVTGAPAQTFQEWAAEHRSEFQG